jgi:alkanesulfonate monooxygenase SsuD/methylene tetrahydromethanopterin reductase-like flavin-dependent oxidoreductase (luciferase family)
MSIHPQDQLMKFGTFQLFSCPPWTNPYDVIEHEYEQAVQAEHFGFDEVWLGEHNGRRYGIVGNSVLSAGVIAARTRRIRIGTAVSRLPLHHPLHLAEDIAHVDIVSRGRFDFGLGKGYDSLEFSTYGVPFDEREERWHETFDAVHHYWTTGRTAYDGRFGSTADGELFPLPLQRPAPPIYVIVSRSDSSVVWAAERLYPFILGSACDREDTRHKLALFERTALAAGHAERDVRTALDDCWQLRQVHVASSRPRAMAEFEQSMMWYFETRQNRVMFGYPGEIHPYTWYLENGFVLLGTPEDVADDIGAYSAATGMKNFLCWFNVGGQPQAQVLTAMHRFAEETVPLLDRRLPTTARHA